MPTPLVYFFLSLVQEDMVKSEYFFVAIFSLNSHGGVIVDIQNALHFRSLVQGLVFFDEGADTDGDDEFLFLII